MHHLVFTYVLDAEGIIKENFCEIIPIWVPKCKANMWPWGGAGYWGAGSSRSVGGAWIYFKTWIYIPRFFQVATCGIAMKSPHVPKTVDYFYSFAVWMVSTLSFSWKFRRGVSWINSKNSTQSSFECLKLSFVVLMMEGHKSVENALTRRSGWSYRCSEWSEGQGYELHGPCCL